MNQDVQKFIDLLKSDESLQDKMKTAADQYTGDHTPEVAFQNVVLPIAEEADCHFTWEEFLEYVKQGMKELNTDEMEQVTGGHGKGKGYGSVGCIGIGFGLGGAAGDGTGGSCLLLGVGWGGDACWDDGATFGFTE